MMYQETLPWCPPAQPIEVVGTHAQLHPNKAVEFMLAGNARFTLRSVQSGVRYTYKIRKSDDRGDCVRPTVWFVSLLTGSDNNSDYTYMGLINSNKFGVTRKSKYSETSQPVVAFKWVWGKLIANLDPHGVEIWHSGRCGRCGRSLTVPESIESGFGPECIGKLGP